MTDWLRERRPHFVSDWIALLSQQPTRPKTNEEKQRATFDMNYEICVKSTPHILTTIDRRVNSGDEAINIQNPTSRIKTDTWCVSMKWQHPVFTCRFSDCVPESCIFSPPVMTTENTTWSTISSFTLLIIPYSYNNTIYFLRYQKNQTFQVPRSSFQYPWQKQIFDSM